MGGGNVRLFGLNGGFWGLSPRGRGKRTSRMGAVGSLRSIPAWAGETRFSGQCAGPSAVYPRVGGGNRSQPFWWRTISGLSPRGRGKLEAVHELVQAPGSIPAWAGETGPGRPAYCGFGVYPRVGGGNDRAYPDIAGYLGLSPRGRGKRLLMVVLSLHLRSIPAWAGETSTAVKVAKVSSVYPRVGGGNHEQGREREIHSGLSPRGRGKLFRVRRHPLALRSIPAWAGETNTPGSWDNARRVYPRVGGGNAPSRLTIRSNSPLSPRGRGKRRRRVPGRAHGRSIPAWAGETPPTPQPMPCWGVYPRVGGGNGSISS